jgi:methyltransferase-like protein/SAM-dependent methyltransferase
VDAAQVDGRIPGRTARMNSYDDLPYPSQAFAQTHPDRLATLARIFGLAPPSIERCRVLELGCASGGNLVPMAYGLPGSEFVGVDLSERQVAEGRTRIDALKLANVRIEHASILDIDERWGEFDYVICHGVFSWVEAEVQDRILQIAGRQLSPNGIAYVSYNTYPGWHMRESVRHMMRYHAMPFDSPPERIEQARALLDFLAGAVPREDNAYGQMLGRELELLRRCSDSYLYHEHLEPTNVPLYFHQFVERAGRHGLQYLAEADFAAMLAGRFPPEVAQTLEAISEDIVHLEQYMDFVRNRQFRQTLLCRAGLRPRRALSPGVMQGLHVASAARRDGDEPVDLSDGVELTFRHTGSVLVSTGHPVTKAALLLLGERWPRGMVLEDLLAQACGLVDRPGGGEVAMQDLFQCYLSGLVELRSLQVPCTSRVSKCPVVSACAVLEASTSDLVTSLRHDAVRLEPFSRALLPRLDGSRTSADLAESLIAPVAAGSLALPQRVGAPTDPDALAVEVAQWVDLSLESLARHALLVG